MQFMDWIVIVVSIILITLVSLQSAKGDLGEAITGGNSELFKNQKERGLELLLSRLTLGTTIVLILLTFIASI